MCQLCGDKAERESRRGELKYLAEQLDRMASFIRMVAAGEIKPHTSKMKNYTALVHDVIRQLVNDWM